MKAVQCHIVVSKGIYHSQNVSCFTHEIPIYKRMYSQVSISEQPQPDIKKDVGSAHQEYDRLIRKFGEKEGQSPVHDIYQNKELPLLGQHIGLKLDKFFEISKEEKAAIKAAKAEAKAAKDAADSEADELEAKTADLPKGNPTKKDLEAWLQERDIEYDDAMTATDLMAWAHSSLTQFVRAMGFKGVIPEDAGVNALISLYETEAAA